MKVWDKPNIGNFDQDNNGVENLVTKILNDYGIQKKLHRESCGSSSYNSCMEVLGAYVPGEDEVVCWMNTPGNCPDRPQPANRYFDNYIRVVRHFNPEVKYQFINFPNDDTHTKADIIAGHLTDMNTVAMVNLKDPGHYLSVHHVKNGVVYYSDSWVGNYWNPSPACKRTMALEPFSENCEIGILLFKF